MNEGSFDHSPALLTVYPRANSGRKPFRYFTMWRHNELFLPRVATAWQTLVRGTKMFFVVQRLKDVKKELKELNRLGFNDVQAADAKAFQDIQQAESMMHANPGQIELADTELQALT